MSGIKDVIRLGDILVFKAGDDWIGKSIAWLTKSDVSHAAMVYTDNSIVEMGASGIMVNNIVESPNGELIHLLRLDSELEPSPLIAAAKAYISGEVKYDFPALVLLAGLLIYREIRPTPKLCAITDTILRLACAEIDRLIMSLRKDGKQTMVCSQLVYQCYLDCAPDYLIHLKGGNFQSSSSLDGDGMGTIRLIDRLDSVDMGSFNATPDLAIPNIDTEEAAKELYAALTDKMDYEYSGNAELASSMDGIIDIAKLLLYKLEAFLREHEADIPIQSLFVTPSDLLNHSINLLKKGEFYIDRVK